MPGVGFRIPDQWGGRCVWAWVYGCVRVCVSVYAGGGQVWRGVWVCTRVCVKVWGCVWLSLCMRGVGVRGCVSVCNSLYEGVRVCVNACVCVRVGTGVRVYEVVWVYMSVYKSVRVCDFVRVWGVGVSGYEGALVGVETSCWDWITEVDSIVVCSIAQAGTILYFAYHVYYVNKHVTLISWKLGFDDWLFLVGWRELEENAGVGRRPSSRSADFNKRIFLLAFIQGWGVFFVVQVADSWEEMKPTPDTLIWFKSFF